jgi:hypothetical protein
MKYFNNINNANGTKDIHREEAVRTQERSQEADRLEQQKQEHELMRTEEKDQGGSIGRPVL